MLNIESILNHVLQSVLAGDERYEVVDDEHIVDRKTGVSIHVYDDWFKVTHGDEVVVTKNDFTPVEQSIFWKIKNTITSAETRANKENNYKALQETRRVHLSSLYEKPTPLDDNLPVAEVGAEVYTG